MVNIEINGKPVAAREGSMLLEAADEAGITIPRFCYHSKLSIAASCRMCLVEVEKVPKPLPACATPVSEGMKAYTRSPRAIAAQRSVMEFLLINHPLDCPICDQGGECELQEMALGYGNDVSRYAEAKRVVHSPDLGPLIATDMSRCIHCTRCVRFGEEIGGMMELGAPGRGEHMHIATYMEHSVDSELSGNVVDLCPVGALTSKPYRYSARPWELQSHHTVSPHDCVGTNIRLDSRSGRAMRVVARDNEAVNECWIADRDRFSYTALEHEDRLRKPQIKRDGVWQECDWDTALTTAVEGLKQFAADQLGALAAYGATNEEHFLLQRLMRGIGSANIDHRLRQQDFRDQNEQGPYPALGQPIAALEQNDAVLLVGSNIRKEQPLLAQRLRKAVRGGARVMAINPVDYAMAFTLAEKRIALDLVSELLAVAKALLEGSSEAVPQWLTTAIVGVAVEESHRAIAGTLRAGKQASVLLGAGAQGHPAAAELRAVANLIASLSGAHIGILAEGGNAAGAALAGCLPHRGAGCQASDGIGLDWKAMFAAKLPGYLLLGVEPEYDCIDSAAALQAMQEARFVVAINSYASVAMRDYADVLLPAATFAETAGSLVNTEGQWQGFNGAATAPGEARPAWKILRVLGNLFDINGFEQNSAEEVRAELEAACAQLPAAPAAWQPKAMSRLPAGLLRIADVPIYAVDAMVRRAAPLQTTADADLWQIRLNSVTAEKAGFSSVVEARLIQGAGEVVLPLLIDERLPDNAVYLPAGLSATVGLGGGFAAVELTHA
ncbi:MAG: NADH-quinone oxidoreductase subunit NuoG [Gammaproteobacteria bacterium]|nr:NADH-quinone oxidoreductase subunit NuoG [Gammaproteobacteria bacterium]